MTQKAAYELALAGNPNVGKSSLFNALTGLHQHTGNWPGKTVAVARGEYAFAGACYAVTDLPGTYSLTGGSEEERIAAEYLRDHAQACVVAVCDATCLARSLALALQLMQRCKQVIVCVNLMDEARATGLRLNLQTLQALLGVPVIGTCASNTEDIRRLRQCIRDVQEGFVVPRAKLPPWRSVAGCIRYARELADTITTGTSQRRDTRLDRFLTGRYTGLGVCAALLFVLFWLTLAGSNKLSDVLQAGFDALENVLVDRCASWPPALQGALLQGVYATAARVVAVMLPPAAIFFLLFSLLEDVGYLPRAAFLADQVFAPCGTSGRQALSMCMGLGCNAVGITGARIIDSKRERLLAVLTNSFMPCNGRLPMLMSVVGATFILFSGSSPSLLVAAVLILLIVLSVCATFLFTFILSRTVLRGERSSFTIELPPYRRPEFLKVTLNALTTRVAAVLWRAIAVAAPMGLVIFLLSNVTFGGIAPVAYAVKLLEPVGQVMGLDGEILFAFVLGLPANEIVLPILVMLYTSGGSFGTDIGVSAMSEIFAANGWTLATSVCMTLFALFHWPCSTSVITVYKETGSKRYTALAVLLPTLAGMTACFIVNLIFKLL